MESERLNGNLTRFFLIVGTVLLTICAGCSEGKDRTSTGRIGPEPLLGENEFADLFVEMAKAKDEYTSDYEALKKRQQAILKERNLSFDDIERTIEYLKKEPERWERVLIAVKARLNEDAKTLDDKR